MPSSLTLTVAAARDRLTDNMHQTTGGALPFQPGDTHARVNAFLAAASQHACAAESTLVDEVRRHLDAKDARELRRASHMLMLWLRTMHARLYGSSPAMHVPWRVIWNEVARHLDVLLDVEERIAAGLTETLPEATVEQLVDRLREAEANAPTRPHPHLPRRGVAGRFARRVACSADAFWDGVQGRVVVPTDNDPAGAGAA